jgi:hypothetical protein
LTIVNVFYTTYLYGYRTDTLRGIQRDLKVSAE